MLALIHSSKFLGRSVRLFIVGGEFSKCVVVYWFKHIICGSKKIPTDSMKHLYSFRKSFLPLSAHFVVEYSFHGNFSGFIFIILIVFSRSFECSHTIIVGIPMFLSLPINRNFENIRLILLLIVLLCMWNNDGLLEVSSFPTRLFCMTLCTHTRMFSFLFCASSSVFSAKTTPLCEPSRPYRHGFFSILLSCTVDTQNS